jgi:hypothetical protein
VKRPDETDTEYLYRRIDNYTVIDESTGCWFWTSIINHGGYGIVKMHKRPYRVHRVSYERHVGPIPHHLVLDHLCRNRDCLNPKHLEPVTSAENLRRGRDARMAQSKVPEPPMLAQNPTAGRFQ